MQVGPMHLGHHLGEGGGRRGESDRGTCGREGGRDQSQDSGRTGGEKTTEKSSPWR